MGRDGDGVRRMLKLSECQPTPGLARHLVWLADHAWACRVLTHAGRGRTQGRLRESPARRWGFDGFLTLFC